LAPSKRCAGTRRTAGKPTAKAVFQQLRTTRTSKIICKGFAAATTSPPPSLRPSGLFNWGFRLCNGLVYAARKGCISIMDVHKREIVGMSTCPSLYYCNIRTDSIPLCIIVTPIPGTFLSVSEQIGSHGKTTRGPTRLRKICDSMTKSCDQSCVQCAISELRADCEP
jgi:hypothetical protein